MEAALIALLSLVYFSSVANMQWSTHDREYMSDSAAISSDPSRFLAADKLIPGRPTLEFVIWLWYSAWGNSPAAFHWLGIALHAAASALLVYVARQLGWSRPLSLVAGLLFLTHVGHFRAIHWVAAFCYPLVLIGGLVALLWTEHYARRGRKRHLIGIYAISILAMGTHPSSAFIYPTVLLWYLLRRQSIAAVLKLVPLGFLMAGCAWLLTVHYSAAPQNAVLTDRFELVGSVEALAALFSRLFTTAQSMPVSPYAHVSWEVLIALPLFLGLGLYGWKYNRSMLFWLAWAVLSLLPFLSLQIDAQGQLVAGPSGSSRYLYVASAGSSCVLAAVAQKAYLYLSRRVGEDIARWIGAAILLSALGSSYIWLKRTEGISLYVSGRYYEASGDRGMSIELFELAIARGRSLVNGPEIYSRAYLPLASRRRKTQAVARGGLGLSSAKFATKCLPAHYAIYDGRRSGDRVSTPL